MKIYPILFALMGITGLSVVQAAEAAPEPFPLLALSSVESSQLVKELAASAMAPVLADDGSARWGFASLSCILASVPAPEATGGTIFVQRQCSLENEAGNEVTISEDLSAKLIENLEVLGVKPFPTGSTVIRIYTVKEFSCESAGAEPTAQCQFSSEPAFPFSSGI